MSIATHVIQLGPDFRAALTRRDGEWDRILEVRRTDALGRDAWVEAEVDDLKRAMAAFYATLIQCAVDNGVAVLAEGGR